MIQSLALSKNPLIWLFVQPRVTLGYGTFDFEVEEFPVGALPIAEVSSGFCEIGGSDAPKGDPLKRETIAMFDGLTPSDIVDVLEESAPFEAFAGLIERTRRAVERLELERYQEIKSAQAEIADDRQLIAS